MDAVRFEEDQALGVCLALAADLIIEEPDEARIRSYIEADVFAEAPIGMGNARIERGLADLKSWCDAFVRMDDDAAAQALRDVRSAWFSLFAGCGAPEAPCWATFYLDPNGQMLGAETLKVREAYRGYGLRIERSNAEPDDHLAFMVRFCAALLALEVQASQSGDEARAAELRAFQRTFVVEHILPWLAKWEYLALKHARSAYYEGVARLTFGFIEEYASRFNIEYRAATQSFVAHAV